MFSCCVSELVRPFHVFDVLMLCFYMQYDGKNEIIADIVVVLTKLLGKVSTRRNIRNDPLLNTSQVCLCESTPLSQRNRNLLTYPYPIRWLGHFPFFWLPMAALYYFI